MRYTLFLTTLLSVSLILSGCGTMADRLSQVGEAPPLTPIQNPNAQPNYQPVSMPMPNPEYPQNSANSLWRSGSRAFFKDQRAAKVGDILTVVIQIDDKAQIADSTVRSRNSNDSLGVPSLFGLETQYGKVISDSADPASLISATGAMSNTGKGTIDRSEKIELQVAATINQILPNGNMVVSGLQEVRVNNEVRVLQISGIIRPEDVTSSNSISYEKIAEARISYGGRGHISDVQQPRYGSQILDIISPF